MGKQWKQWKTLFLGGPKSLQMVTAAMKLKEHLFLGRKAMINPESILKSRDITLPTMVRLVKAMVFPVFMYRCESWTRKNAEHQRIGDFELWCWRRLLRVPWTTRRSVHPKGNQSWIFIGRSDAKAEASILWPPDVKNWLIWKEANAGKDWRQDEMGITEDEMVGCHHLLNVHEFEQSLEQVMDREAWHAAVHGVAKSRIWLSN